MASGFIDVASTQTPTSSCQGSNNWGSGILISTPRVASPSDTGLPSSGVQWSHLELILEDNGQTNAVNKTAAIFLSWDAAGDNICAGPSNKATLVAGRSDTDRYMVVFELYPQVATVPVSTDDGTGQAGRVYLWLQTTNFTDTTPPVIRARLHWHELSKG